MNTSILTRTLQETDFGILPGEDELPYDDGEPLESERHLYQIFLLIETLRPWMQKTGAGYIGGNMFLYFSPRQIKTEKVRGPDFFVVTDAKPRERKSWVVWEEGLCPNVVIELLSETTKTEDKNRKKTIYEKEVGVNEYYWYDPFYPEDWVGHNLVDGVYQRKNLDSKGRYISQELGLALVRWEGVFLGVESTWLRFETLGGKLLPTKEELKVAAKQREKEAKQREKEAKQREKEAKQREKEERERADKAEQNLREVAKKLKIQGMKIEVISNTTGLHIEEIESL